MSGTFCFGKATSLVVSDRMLRRSWVACPLSHANEIRPGQRADVVEKETMKFRWFNFESLTFRKLCSFGSAFLASPDNVFDSYHCSKTCSWSMV